MSAKRNILPVFVPHAGCPHRCVFCDQKRISGSDTTVTPDSLRTSILEASDSVRAPLELAFYGGSFTAIPVEIQKSLLSVVQPFLVSGVLSSIRVSTRPDAVSSDALALLRDYGVKTVELGCQSMDDAVLSCCGRGHTSADCVSALLHVKEAGFTVVAQMMTGLPGADDAGDRMSAEKLISLRPDAVRIYPTVVVRGTPLFDLWKSGAYAAHTVEHAVALCAVLVPLFESAGIPVIRIGLNPTDSLSAGDAAAGAYHPALGALVRSEILLNLASASLNADCAGKRAVLSVHPSCVSAMTGDRKRNLHCLRERFGLDSVSVCGDPSIPRQSVRVNLL